MNAAVIVCALTTFAGTAAAFEPIPNPEVPSLFGKTVYAATTSKKEVPGVRGGVVVLAGDALTLTSCKLSGSTINNISGKGYYVCDVKNADGTSISVNLKDLSKEALAFSLRKPGKAAELLAAIFKDAYALGMKLHKMEEKAEYEVDNTALTEKDGTTYIGVDYEIQESMKAALEFEAELLNNLVQGSRYRKDSVMRDPLTKWAATADDGDILEWYAEGIPDDAPAKKRFTAANDAVKELWNAHSAGASLRSKKKDAEKKEWRRGLSDMPEDKLKKLDKEELAKIDKDIKAIKKRIADGLKKAAKDEKIATK